MTNDERKELIYQVGCKMIEITTSVWYEDEWLAIPEIWLGVMKERDELLKLVEDKYEQAGNI